MKQSKSFCDARGTGRAIIVVVLAISCVRAFGVESTNIMVKPPVPMPGGLGLRPVVTSVSRTQDLVTVSFFGIQGPYQVLHSPTADGDRWDKFGPSTYRAKVTGTISGDTGFF